MEAGQIDVTILSVPVNYVAAEKGLVKILMVYGDVAHNDHNCLCPQEVLPRYHYPNC